MLLLISGKAINVPPTTKKRGRWGIRKIFWKWPKGEPRTLEEAVQHLVDHWEEGG